MTFVQNISNYASGVCDSLITLFSAPGSFLSPAPLLVAGMLGAIIIGRRLRAAGKAAGFRAVIGELFPARVWKQMSARHDVFIVLINEGLLFFVGGLAFLAVEPLRDAAVTLIGVEGALEQPARTGVIAKILFGIYFAFAWDFFTTYAHYLKHKVPFLWEFHKVHHCAEVLTPLTAMRRHPVEIVASAIITGLGIAFALILWLLIFGAPGTSLEIGGTALVIYVWRIAGYNLRHSHIWISYGPFWNRYLVSPAHHQLHHSRAPKHHDCNFGHIFTIWDRMLGTHYAPIEGETFELGIEREENAKLGTLRALYVRPLHRAFALLTPKQAAPVPPPAE